MSMDALYQEIILDHSRRPRHAGLREPFDAQVHQVNPTCGDEVTLRLTLAPGDGDASPVIADLSYDALGCSISQAATSVMTGLLIGRDLDAAAAIVSAYEAMVTSKGADPGDEELLGDGVAFAGVAQYPNRVKCALLGWKAFQAAVIESGQATAGRV